MMDPSSEWAVVPAHGEVLVCLYEDEDWQEGDGEACILLQMPIVAWRIQPRYQRKEDTPIPILPLNCEMPGEKLSPMTGIMMPDGTVYSDDGYKRFATVDDFRLRWDAFYKVRARERIAKAAHTPA